eukprot:1152346-Pelagomonas_calceolata.AAC.13
MAHVGSLEPWLNTCLDPNHLNSQKCGMQGGGLVEWPRQQRLPLVRLLDGQGAESKVCGAWWRSIWPVRRNGLQSMMHWQL